MPAAPAPAAGATQWTLTGADLIAAAGTNGVLAMQDLGKALPLIASCQMDATCSLQSARVASPSDPHDSHDHAGEDDGVQAWMAAVGAITFFIIPIISAVTPFWMSRVVHPDTFTMLFSLGNCFSAGLMFSLGMMHIVPETMEAQWKVPMDYPLNFYLIVMGFFVTLFLEQIPSAHVRSFRCRQSSRNAVVCPSHESDHAPESAAIESGSRKIEVEAPKAAPPRFMDRVDSLMPVLVFFVASQFHACLEALFVGVTQSSTNFWILFGGVAVHKGFVALTFGMKVYSVWGASDSFQRWTLRVVSLLWALLPALCVLIGYFISATIDPVALLVLSSLAAGTFLYIGSFEILSEEFEHSHYAGDSPALCIDPVEAPRLDAWGTKTSHRYSKFLAIAVGILVVSLMGLIPHTH